MPSTTIEGEETTAVVQGLSEDQLEELLVEQLQEMVDHEAFQGDVRIMTDTHPGSGAVIGFTMNLDHDGPLRVCPSSVGVDIGCGMLAASIDVESDARGLIADWRYEVIDDRIRSVVPMGRSTHSRADFHMGEDFDWGACTSYWEQTKDQLDLDDPDWFDGYGLGSYFKPLCERISYDPMRAINSVGTLGGGNHFIELGTDEDGTNWLVIHSGSRGIGLAIATYWQDEATDRRTSAWIREQLAEELEPYIVPDLDDEGLVDWFQGAKGQSYIDSESIREDVSNNHLIGYLHNQIRTAHPSKRNTNEDLDYLEGQEAAGYLVDMIFAQQYAKQNRREMLDNITDAVGWDVMETIDSPHNLVDFNDLVLRKGATSAHEGEQFVLPFNMSDGTFICTGTGNDDWNNSAPHGAGRVMSRTRAFNELDMEDFERQMEGIYSSSVTEETLDEAPQAYKDTAIIASALTDTATVLAHIKPVLNIKALE